MGRVKGELLLRFRDDVTAEQKETFSRTLQTTYRGRGARPSLRLTVPRLGIHRITLPTDIDANAFALALNQHPFVQYAHPNHTYRPTDYTPNDPGLSSMWGPQKISAPAAWQYQRGSKNIVVAIIDTGIDATHPDLNPQIARDSTNPSGYLGINFAPTMKTPAENPNYDLTDLYGHGSHTAGTAAAATDNNTGVVGIGFNVSIMPVKIFDPNIAGGDATDECVASAITWATDHGARVISMSIGGQDDGTGEPAVMRQAMQYAWDHNVVVVAAAGNAGTTVPSWPGADPIAIGVSATNSSDGSPGWTNYGRWVWCAAPGDTILSTYARNMGGDYATLSGTSMATPHVSGLAALVLSMNPNLTNAQVKEAIKNGTDKVGGEAYDQTTGKSPHYGYGRINALKTLVAANITTLTVHDRSQNPVSGAEVHLFDVNSNQFIANTAVTDSTGTAKLTGVPIGKYHIGAYKPGYNAWVSSPGLQGYAITPEPSAAASMDVVLDTTDPATGGIFGYVWWNSASGLRWLTNAHIDVYSGGHLVGSADTNGNSFYRVRGLNGLPGLYGYYTYIATFTDGNGVPHRLSTLNFGVWANLNLRTDIAFPL